MSIVPTPLAVRFKAKYRVNAATGCWEWTGQRIPTGYGYISRGGRGGGMISAHRASHEIHIGPIPKGHWVCHRCDNPGCVNPEHLFSGPPRVNVIDCVRKGRHRNQNDHKTHCRNGHPLAGKNLRVEATGFRRCITCQRAYERRWRNTKKESKK